MRPPRRRSRPDDEPATSQELLASAAARTSPPTAGGRRRCRGDPRPRAALARRRAGRRRGSAARRRSRSAGALASPAAGVAPVGRTAGRSIPSGTGREELDLVVRPAGSEDHGGAVLGLRGDRSREQRCGPLRIRVHRRHVRPGTAVCWTAASAESTGSAPRSLLPNASAGPLDWGVAGPRLALPGWCARRGRGGSRTPVRATGAPLGPDAVPGRGRDPSPARCDRQPVRRTGARHGRASVPRRRREADPRSRSRLPARPSLPGRGRCTPRNPQVRCTVTGTPGLPAARRRRPAAAVHRRRGHRLADRRSPGDAGADSGRARPRQPADLPLHRRRSGVVVARDPAGGERQHPRRGARRPDPGVLRRREPAIQASP